MHPIHHQHYQHKANLMEIDNVDVQEFFEHLYIHQPKEEEKKRFSKTFSYEISLDKNCF
jgi:hypothetical protein